MRLFFIALLFFSSCDNYNEKSEERIAMIRDYSFCSCFEYSLGNDLTENIREIDFSRALLFDISEDVSLYFSKIDSMAKLESMKIESTQIQDYNNRKPIILRCLEFSRSSTIDSLIDSIIK